MIDRLIDLIKGLYSNREYNVPIYLFIMDYYNRNRRNIVIILLEIWHRMFIAEGAKYKRFQSWRTLLERWGAVIFFLLFWQPKSVERGYYLANKFVSTDYFHRFLRTYYVSRSLYLEIIYFEDVNNTDGVKKESAIQTYGIEYCRVDIFL